MKNKKIIKKMTVFLLSLGLVLGALVSCENRLIEKILGEEDTGSGKTPGGGGNGGGGGDSGGEVTDWDEDYPGMGVRLNRTKIQIGTGRSYQLEETMTGPGMVGGIRWISGDPAIASVDQEGKVTAVSKGETTITIKNGDKSAACTVVVYDSAVQDLAIKLGVTTEGPEGVNATFRALHEYLEFLSTEPVDDAINELKTEGFIRLGDYVDLPSLYVDGYQGADDTEPLGVINETAEDPATNFGEKGRLLRIMVVGRNSFNPGAGNSDYKGGVDKAMPHLVMQFQNLPVARKIHGANVPMAYKDSDMRKYLVKVSSPEVLEEGNFTKGLILAGVPMNEDIIWAPNRELSNADQTAVDEIKDKLWIPTEWEMLGAMIYSNGEWENKYNQAFLEYYREVGDKVKYIWRAASPYYRYTDYWTASLVNNDSKKYCVLLNGGLVDTKGVAAFVGYIAPAFCVK